MTTYNEIWKDWYEAQNRELDYHRQHFSYERPSLQPASSFDPEEDANVLRKAMKGLGTTEEDLIKILTRRTLNQRMKIEETYQQIHGRDLSKDLKEELNGIFEKVILSLLKPSSLFLAEQIKHATKGAGTDETALIEIFCTRDDESIKTIKETFENQYEKSIEEVVCKETKGSFEKTLMSILSFARDDEDASRSEVSDQLCAEEIDEDGIRKILTSHSLSFLKDVFILYNEKSGEDFLDLVANKCSGDAKEAFEAIYLSSKSRPEFFAHALNKAMSGMGTDDWALIRIIVSRCEIDLEDIKEKYQELYDKDLIEQVKNETNGDYESVLLGLLGAPLEE